MLQSLNEELGQAAFPGGEGEQHWGGKRKRRYMKENVSYTPEKRTELIDKYNKSVSDYKGKVERYINIFKGFNLEDLTINTESAKKFVKTGEALVEEFRKISKILWDIIDQYDEEGDNASANKVTVMEEEYDKFKTVVEDVYSAMEDIISIMEKIKLQ